MEYPPQHVCNLLKRELQSSNHFQLRLESFHLFRTLSAPFYLKNGTDALQDVMSNWTRLELGPHLVTSFVMDMSNSREHAIYTSGWGMSVLQHYEINRDVDGLYQNTLQCSCLCDLTGAKYAGPGAPCHRDTSNRTANSKCAMHHLKELPKSLQEVIAPDILDTEKVWVTKLKARWLLATSLRNAPVHKTWGWLLLYGSPTLCC